MGIKNTGELPRIYSCSDDVNNVDYIDINFSAISLTNLPTISAMTDSDINVHVSDITKNTARIHFSQKYVGKVYYTVIGFN